MRSKRYTTQTLIIIIALCTFLFSGSAVAASITSAMKNAVRDIKRSGKIPESSNIVVSGITNYYTGVTDELGKAIETDLFFAFESEFPGARLVDIDESVTGVSSGNTVFIKGNYQKKGNKGKLYLKAYKGNMNGEVIYQSVVEFDTEYRKTNLVAVLDIVSKVLNIDQKRIFSDVFREALGESGAFNMISSADIDRIKPEELQKTTGCTGDSCAALIGKQLGVGRVISTSLRKLNEKTFYFSGKILNIKDGSIVSAKTVKHSGDLSTFDAAVVELAKKLTEDMAKPKAAVVGSTSTPSSDAPAISVTNDFVYDEKTGLYWQKGEGGSKPWSEAMSYCKTLNLGGRDDWRLPDHKELESSFALNDQFPDLVNNYYWSSTTNKDYKYYAWGMTSSSGYMFNDGNKTSHYNVRCVSGVKEPEKGFIVDKETGLEWQKGEGGTKPWQQAQKYCQRLEIDGLTNWRLPSVEELRSAYRMKDQFPDMADGYYWTNTTNASYPDYAWGMYSSDGSFFDNGYKTEHYNVRCVRGEVDQTALVLVDEESNLMWQKGEAGEFSWADGVEYCKTLDLGEHTDWRLPNKDELESSFALQDQFPGLVDGYYWSSTPGSMGIWAWGLTTSTGALFDNGMRIKSYNVRCVRDNFK